MRLAARFKLREFLNRLSNFGGVANNENVVRSVFLPNMHMLAAQLVENLKPLRCY